MRSWLAPRFERFLYALYAFRIAVLSVGAFLSLSMPDVWRQVLCLGVSMRYWSRWMLEPSAGHWLLPAILDAGDAQGIMPMEFPLIYVLTAPLFALGPHWGRALSIIACAATAFGLSLVNARVWRGKRIAGVEARIAMLLLPIFAISLIWSGKYMPDYLSMLLVCLALGLSWDEERPVASFLLATLALLLKPTSIIVLMILFLNPALGLKKLLRWARWAAPAVGISLGYYTLGMRFLASFQDTPSVVGVEPRSPLTGAIDFFRNLPFIFHFYSGDAFFGGGIVLILGVTIWNRWKHREHFPVLLWLLSFAQFFALSVMDGGILFYDHRYYLMAIAPTLCLLFADALARCRNSLVYLVLVLGILVPVLENSLRELKPLYRRAREPVWTVDRQVRDLERRNPQVPWRQGHRFRAAPEPFPELGLYFGEIEGSPTAEFGFFRVDQPVPAGCAAIDRTEWLVITKCGKG